VGSAPGAPAEQNIILTEEFRHALALLAGGDHLFLTGKATTGKSTLIRRFMADTDRNVLAPTGIAARNVDGHTIHRPFGFPTTMTLHDVRGAVIGRGDSRRRWRRWTR
jgi:ATP-dependent DNA helicase PIF1